jgi:uncharacterized damage-inducible protein DinB
MSNDKPVSSALFAQLAHYNRWMNARLYEAAARLTDEELRADKGAFFGSILATLNHIAIADVIWLKRFSEVDAWKETLAPIRAQPWPDTKGLLRFQTLEALLEHRTWLDGLIEDWSATLEDGDLGQELHYRNLEGQGIAGMRSHLIMHFFNHQTHHRGQVTTLLFQAGIDMGSTDLHALVSRPLMAGLWSGPT